jgi:uncharacterized RmlC-like cupin family protein
MVAPAKTIPQRVKFAREEWMPRTFRSKAKTFKQDPCGEFRRVATSRTLGHRIGMSESRPLSISVVHPNQFSEGTSQTPGSLRLAAVSADLGIHSALWGGTFLVEPGAQTGIHHHGRQETVAYVLEGESYIQWGERGEHSVNVRAGDFLHVPAWLVHREINRSKEFPFRWVVIRSTSEPIVVNLTEDAWK